MRSGTDTGTLAFFTDIGGALLFTPDQKTNSIGAALRYALRRRLSASQPNGVDALIHAIQYHHSVSIRRVLNSGVNLNSLGHDGMTPLETAIIYRLPDLATEMIRKGAHADLKATNHDGATALEVARAPFITEAHFQICVLLLKASDK
jgi:ankyrin repeat protein